MLNLLGLCLLLADGADLEVCQAAVRAHCTEVSCEVGKPLPDGKVDCDQAYYRACVEKGEEECRLRFQKEGR